jgi:Kef-type K+ transport system membrane component KefB
MQLIALNVGLQAHIVNSAMFTSLVLVALVTTIMASPLLEWLNRRDARRRAAEPAADATPAAVA